MKISLLTSVSSAALGVGLVALTPTVANASLSCVAITPGVSGKCSETLTIPSTSKLGQTFSTLGNFTIDKWVPATIVNGYQKLISVSISETGNVNSTGTVTLGGNGGTGGAGVKSGFQTLGGGTAPSNFPTLSTGNVFATTSFTQAASTSKSYSPTTPFGPLTANITTSLSEWQSVSASTFTAAFQGKGSSFYTGPAGGSAVFNATANSPFTITYNYTTNTAPEPASLVVLGASMAGLGIVRRRRSKTA